MTTEARLGRSEDAPFRMIAKTVAPVQRSRSGMDDPDWASVARFTVAAMATCWMFTNLAITAVSMVTVAAIAIHG